VIYASSDSAERASFLRRIVAACLAAAVLGLAMALAVGAEVDSPVAIAGAVLVLVAVTTGLVALLIDFALGITQIFPSLRKLGRDYAPEDAGKAEGGVLREQDQAPIESSSGFFAFVVGTIVFVNVAIMTFMFSPLGRNPFAVAVVALVGGLVAVLVGMLPRTRAFVRRFMTQRRG